MSTKQLLFPAFMYIASNMTFSMDSCENKINIKKDKIRLRDEGNKIKLVNNHGVSTGYMIKNKSDRGPRKYTSYSPEEKATFLEAYMEYSDNHMSPPQDYASIK